MTRTRLLLFVVLVAAASIGCQSSDGGARCETDDSLLLAETDWPRFRRDLSNTGRIEGVTISDTYEERWVFPSRDSTRTLGPISSTVLVGDDRIYVVGRPLDRDSGDISLYVLDAGGGTVQNNVTPTPEPTPTVTPSEAPPVIERDTSVNGSPLLANDGTVFVPFTTGTLGRYATDGELETQNLLSGFITASPNLGRDGTVYIGSRAGVFAAVCANGVSRFNLVVPATESTVAIADGETSGTEDDIIVLATTDGQVRGLDIEGRQLWAFFASAPIINAVVLDTVERMFVVADNAGRVFAGDLDTGERLWVTSLPDRPEIIASPALGHEALYVAAASGVLRALDPATGEILWDVSFTPERIESSPLVAVGDDAEVVVLATGDGVLHAVENRGTTAESRVVFATDPEDGGIGRSAPSIDRSGTLYIGTLGGRIYAIAPAGSATGTATPLPTATPTPTP